MALKSSSGSQDEPLDTEEMLELLEQQIERLKVMYEQYFMGIQKMAPGQLHRDVERGIRELTQMQIRNTALRYRFTNLSQKFGSYNSYWRRTMTEIENGRYIRHISRVARKAQKEGTDVPEELLVKMPKRMREKILRDREAVAKRAEREGTAPPPTPTPPPPPPPDEPARIVAPRVHKVEETEVIHGDVEAMFAAIMDEEPPTRPKVVLPTGPAVPAKGSPPATPPPSEGPPQRRAPPSPNRPPPPPPLRPSRSPVPPPGMTEQQTRELHAKYLQARKLVGDQGEVTYEKLMATLHKQAPKIMQEHGARGVEFNVVIKDNKVILKAKPKK